MKHKNTQILQNSERNSFKNTASSGKNELVKRKIFGIGVTDAKKEEILEYIVNSVKKSQKNYYITTPNPEMVVFAQAHPDFGAILNGAELALCDGVGLLWGARVLGAPLNERFTGVELVEKLCEKVNGQPVTIGFFGGKPGVAEKAAECLLAQYPKLKVVYADSTWWEGLSGHKEVVGSMYQVASNLGSGKGKKPTTSYQLQTTKPIGILFVALGFPKQERWMAEHIGKVPVKVMVGVGGAFDYLSGKIPRAPKWVQNIGMEWAFRLALQPWRLKRQLALPKFVWMVVREKFR